MKRTIRTLGFAAIVLAGTTAVGVPAAFAGDGDVIAEGNCSGSTDWKLKSGPDNRGLETEFEIDSNQVGQRWQVTLTLNGTVAATGKGVTRAPSGSFEFKRFLSNAAGPDVIVGTATNRATGETCTGQVTVP